MKHKVCVKISIVLCFVMILLFVQPAHAYLDPGSGSLMIQLLIAFGLGISYYVKVNWKRLKHFFSSHISNKKEVIKGDDK